MEKVTSKSSLAIVQAYYRNWTSKNYDKAANLLDENIQFEMPINNYENKSVFMQAVKFTGDNATNLHLLTELGNDTEAILIYDFNFAPIGNMRIAEHFKTKNCKIVFIRHIHDTFQLRIAGFSKDQEL